MLKLTDYIGLGNAEYSDTLIGLRLSTRLHIGGKAGPSYIYMLLSGVSPLALTNALGLNYIKALGATEQNGTPTPSNPVDIVCNNGVLKYGQYGKNLFDKNNTQMAKGWRVENDGKVYIDASSQTIVIPVQPNTTYTVQADLTGYNQSARPVGRINFFTTYPVPNTTVGTVHAQVSTQLPHTFTTENNTAYVAIWLNRSGNIAQQVWDSAQLELGSTATEYEPYHFGIHADGTQETVTVADYSKNLFDKTTIISDYRLTYNYNFPYGGGNDIIKSEGSFTSAIIPVEVGKTYFKNSPKEDAYHRYKVYDSKKIGIRLVEKNTVTIQEGEAYIAFCGYLDELDNTILSDSVNVQTANAEMLLKVGNYKDNQELLTGNITRNVGIKVLDGSESWEYQSQYNRFKLGILADNFISIGLRRTPFVVSHFTIVSDGRPLAQVPNNACYSGDPYAGDEYNFFVKTTDFTSVASWTQFLADQYNAGTPVIVIYPLAVSTTETVSGQSLTASGNCTVTATGSLDNLELELSYKQGVTVRVRETSNENLDNEVNVTIS